MGNHCTRLADRNLIINKTLKMILEIRLINRRNYVNVVKVFLRYFIKNVNTLQ